MGIKIEKEAFDFAAADREVTFTDKEANVKKFEGLDAGDSYEIVGESNLAAVIKRRSEDADTTNDYYTKKGSVYVLDSAVPAPRPAPPASPPSTPPITSPGRPVTPPSSPDPTAGAEAIPEEPIDGAETDGTETADGATESEAPAEASIDLEPQINSNIGNKLNEKVQKKLAELININGALPDGVTKEAIIGSIPLDSSIGDMKPEEQVEAFKNFMKENNGKVYPYFVGDEHKANVIPKVDGEKMSFEVTPPEITRPTEEKEDKIKNMVVSYLQSLRDNGVALKKWEDLKMNEFVDENGNLKEMTETDGTDGTSESSLSKEQRKLYEGVKAGIEAGGVAGKNVDADHKTLNALDLKKTDAERNVGGKSVRTIDKVAGGVERASGFVSKADTAIAAGSGIVTKVRDIGKYSREQYEAGFKAANENLDKLEKLKIGRESVRGEKAKENMTPDERFTKYREKEGGNLSKAGTNPGTADLGMQPFQMAQNSLNNPQASQQQLQEDTARERLKKRMSRPE